LRLSFAPFRSLRGCRPGVRKAKPAILLAPGSRELEGSLPSVRRSRLRTCILQAPRASKPSLKSGLRVRPRRRLLPLQQRLVKLLMWLAPQHLPRLFRRPHRAEPRPPPAKRPHRLLHLKASRLDRTIRSVAPTNFGVRPLAAAFASRTCSRRRRSADPAGRGQHDGKARKCRSRNAGSALQGPLRRAAQCYRASSAVRPSVQAVIHGSGAG
jgi:hypothetical protein